MNLGCLSVYACIPITPFCECNSPVSLFRMMSRLFGKSLCTSLRDFVNFRFRFYGDGKDFFIFVLTVKSDSMDFGLGGDTFNSIFHHSF